MFLTHNELHYDCVCREEDLKCGDLEVVVGEHLLDTDNPNKQVIPVQVGSNYILELNNR